MLAYTIESQGKVLTLRCSDSRSLTTESYSDALGFLCFPCDFAVVHNLDIFVDRLTSIMPKALRNKVLKGGRVFTDNRKLYYQSGRIFGVNHTDFYGLSRYTDAPIDSPEQLLELGQKVIAAFKEMGITDITRLPSPVAAYDKLDQLDYPRACDLPDSAFPMMEMCQPIQSREWRDVFKLGHWEANEIADYDLSSAYPYLMSTLPDISKAYFFGSDLMLLDNYTWGVLEGKLTITAPMTPWKGIGTWEETITTDQLRLIERYHLGSFELEHGEFFLLPKPASFPFKETMETLYQARESDNPMVTRIAKAISVGIGGKLAERYSDGSLGDNANPIYALMTTSRCMVKVADFIYRNQLENDLVSVLVDGFLATKRLPIENRRVMGSFRVNDPLPALVLSVEYQWQGNKHPAYVTHDELVKMIKEHPNRTNYWDADINIISYSRRFSKLPRTGGDLLKNKYDSEPYEFKA